MEPILVTRWPVLQGLSNAAWQAVFCLRNTAHRGSESEWKVASHTSQAIELELSLGPRENFWTCSWFVSIISDCLQQQQLNQDIPNSLVVLCQSPILRDLSSFQNRLLSLDSGYILMVQIDCWSSSYHIWLQAVGQRLSGKNHDWCFCLQPMLELNGQMKLKEDWEKLIL